MPSTRLTIERLQADFPEFRFMRAKEFWWSAAQGTVYIDPDIENGHAYTLHELSHALLDHKGYERDVELLKLERDAWEHAQAVLAPKYGIGIEKDVVQDNLDTYRHWLHARSACPECEAIGIQARNHLYRCVACNYSWRVNEARLCALRRYSLQTK